MPPRRPPAPRRRTSRARRGLTLLELVVALAVLGLLLSLGAGAWRVPAPPTDGDVTAAIRTARALAARRGEPVTLRIAPDGAWRVTGDASPDDQPIAARRLERAPGAPLVLHVSSTGACVPEGLAGVRWDPVQCAPVDGHGAGAAR